MDTPNVPEESVSANTTHQQTESNAAPTPSNSTSFNKGRRGRAPARPYNDLRHFLNSKRQAQAHSAVIASEPPPDPRHNFLSDPARDNEHNFERKSYYGSGRFFSNYNSGPPENKHYSGRGRSSERGRGRGHFRRNQRSRSLDGGSEAPVEWQHDAETQSPSKAADQERAGRAFELRGGGSGVQANGNMRHFPGRRRYRSHRPHHGHPQPVNILVECNTSTGERTCTVHHVSDFSRRPPRKANRTRGAVAEEGRTAPGTNDVTPAGAEPENCGTAEERATAEAKSADNDADAAASAQDKAAPDGTQDKAAPDGTQDKAAADGTQDKAVADGTQQEAAPAGTQQESASAGTQQEADATNIKVEALDSKP